MVGGQESLGQRSVGGSTESLDYTQYMGLVGNLFTGHLSPNPSLGGTICAMVTTIEKLGDVGGQINYAKNLNQS